MDLNQLIVFLWKNQYAQSLIILITFFIVGKIVIFVFEKIFLRIAKKTKTLVDDLIVERTKKPISLLLFFIGIKLALIPLDFGKIANFDIDWILVKISESLITIIVTYILIVIFDIIIDQWGRAFAERTKSKLDNQLLSLSHRFMKVTMILLGLLHALSLWGIEVGPFLASLGIAGIAIAFALQSTLGNIFGGIALILDKSVKVGDVIKLNAETFGTVIDVGLRSTKIKTFNNEVIIVPNGKLVDSQIENHVLPDPTARVVVKFGVEYGSEIQKVKDVIMNEINKLDNVLKEPEPQVLFLEMADFSLNFEARFWVNSYKERLSAKEKATCLFYDALNREKIGIPFPTRTLYMKKEE